jgi:hypothetical protein
MMHGLMLAAAIEAAETPESAPAPAPPVESFGRSGSVVLGEIVAARALAVPSPAMAGLGAIGGSEPWSAAWFSFSSTRMAGVTVSQLSAAPAADVFVANGLSIGAALGGGVTKIEDASGLSSIDTYFVSAMPRIGGTLALSRDIAIWPRVGAGLTVFDGPQQHTGIIVRVTFDAPFVFSLGRHVALEAGPTLSYSNYLRGPYDFSGFVGGASAGLSIVL